MKNLKKELQFRGLLKDIANEELLENIINNKSSFYIGIDPTADSIHIGHFLSLSLANIFLNHGLKPIFVVGGFTGMIGDPSGRNSEREVINKNIIKLNVIKITNQIKEIFEKISGLSDVEVFDNTQIYESMSLIDLFQKYGKLFNINTMLNKESVKNRLENGISYTEFSYQVFQAIDFLYLFKNKNVKLQIGGSDQWGNITAGIELIKKECGFKSDVAGITINLLTDENGNKIGKTQGKPMWLEKSKTSVYEIFQYFINQPDATASKLLLQLTNIDEEEYKNVLKSHKEIPKDKNIQNKLAELFISKIYSIHEYNDVKNLSKLLFDEKYYQINENDIDNLKYLPSIKNQDSIMLIDLLIDNKLISSKREFREFLTNESIKINGLIINDEKFKLTNEFILDKFVFINIGKKNKYLIWK